MNMLVESLREAINHPHVANTKNQHEKWFAKILKSKGFKSKSLKEVGLTTDDIRQQLTTLDSNLDFYIEQPLGSQNTPDFVVCYRGVINYIELKSSAKEKITWNGGYPHDGYIYLFSTGIHDAQTVFLGEDAWPADVKEELLSFALSQKERTDNFNQTIGLPKTIQTFWTKIKSFFGIQEREQTKSTSKQSYYTRNMFNDNEKYYSREDREYYENNVFINIFKTSGVADVAAK
jgi:hypothetical protein